MVGDKDPDPKILKGVLMIGVIRGHDRLHIIALINFR